MIFRHLIHSLLLSAPFALVLGTGCQSSPDRPVVRAPDPTAQLIDTVKPDLHQATAQKAQPADSLILNFTGVWIEDSSMLRAASPAEGAITICPDGGCSYRVFDPQLYVRFHVRQTWVDSQHVHMDFFYSGVRSGKGYMVANLVLPKKDQFVAAADLVSGNHLKMRWLNQDFINSVRKNNPESARQPFPTDFYRFRPGKDAACDSL